MTSTRTHTSSAATWSPAGVFSRILCGVDGSDEGFEAVRQVGRLAIAHGQVTLSNIWNTGARIDLGWSPPVSYAPISAPDHVEQSVTAARQLLPVSLAIATSVVEGPPAPMMVIEASRYDATLVAVGTHGHGRLPGILLGSVATQLLHNAPCPVLIARPPAESDGFPRTIMVGTDGSVEAGRAVAVGEALAARLGAELEAVVVSDEDESDPELGGTELCGPGGRHIPLRRLGGSAAKALSELQPDLLVVGSRGLHGLRSLGSVSERVAQESKASVLVVR
jgi:nucleotide-binding universal stress UspA family protein